MEISVLWAFFLFMSGAMAHRLLLKLLNLGRRTYIFKLTLINCIGLLKYVSLNVDSFIENFIKEEKGSAEALKYKATLEYWKELSILTLKTSTPDQVWRMMDIKDWKSAVALVTRLERERDGKKNN